jgi:hypothetical protein
MKAFLRAATTLALTTGLATSAASQGLAGTVADLIRFGNCEESLCLTTGSGAHGSHYLLSAQTAGDELLSFLTGAMTASVGRLPVSSTGGGTTFSFVGGAPVRSTTSAGPIFAERASTLGKGRFLLGANTTHMSFTKLRGESTDSIAFNLAHQDVGEPGLGDAAFESDIIGVTLDLKLQLQATTVFASYGVSDNFDVGIAIPFIMSSLEGTGAGRVFNVTGTVTGAHFFEGADANGVAHSAVDQSAAGIGDIAVRAKIALGGSAERGLALLGDLRLPTGSEEDFHGSGGLAGTWMLAGSMQKGNFAPHANVGVALRTGEGQTNAMLATIGFDHMLSRAATVAFDLLTELQVGDNPVGLPEPIALPTPILATNIKDQKDNPMAVSAGGRFLVGSVTLIGNALIPVKAGGLQSKFAWTFGIERTF